jgi:hypothetical protein
MQFYIGLLVVIIFFVLVYRLFDKNIESKKNFQVISNFESYNAVLQFIMEKAYDITFKDKLLIYSVEGMKISDKEFSIFSKDFANLVFKMMGPRLRGEMIYVFGDEDTLLFNFMDFFNTKYENDEIRKAQQEKIMNSEETA